MLSNDKAKSRKTLTFIGSVLVIMLILFAVNTYVCWQIDIGLDIADYSKQRIVEFKNFNFMLFLSVFLGVCFVIMEGVGCLSDVDDDRIHFRLKTVLFSALFFTVFGFVRAQQYGIPLY
ncbi:hypothetical protein [Photobacterium leiognathi]|uniref:hypothetical protein n=1 Tax=Photobacterium leiognathi TaxID=553611 RepID=UPI002981DD30|nr:hypothetical protein [Photobacterium leiognathi]